MNAVTVGPHDTPGGALVTVTMSLFITVTRRGRRWPADELGKPCGQVLTQDGIGR